MFTEECINTFLENQEQLFPQPNHMKQRKHSLRIAWRRLWILLKK